MGLSCNGTCGLGFALLSLELGVSSTWFLGVARNGLSGESRRTSLVDDRVFGVTGGESVAIRGSGLRVTKALGVATAGLRRDGGGETGATSTCVCLRLYSRGAALDEPTIVVALLDLKLGC